MKFTNEDKMHLCALIAAAVLNNVTIIDTFGSATNVNQMVNSLTLNSLKKMYAKVDKELSETKVSPWEEDNEELIAKRTQLKFNRELLEYIVRYRIENNKRSRNESAIKEIQAEIERIKEENMTPEQRIAALEAQCKELSGEDESEPEANDNNTSEEKSE